MIIDFKTNLYKFIVEHLEQSGHSPSFAEMTEAMSISPRSKSLITRSLRRLEREGKVKLTKEGRRLLISIPSKTLPLLGQISAGTPIEALSDRQSLDLPNLLFSGNNKFALKVKGNSMIEEGIFDGDIIICKQTEVAREGDVVVALIDQHNTTLKRISYQMEGMITLIPANSELKPRAYSPDRITIQGIYVGLIRINS